MASPFLEPFGKGRSPEPFAASPEELRRVRLQVDGEGDPVQERARAAWRVELAREGPAMPDAYDGVTGTGVDLSDRTFAVTELEALGQCPFKWFAARLLRLSEPEEAPEDLDASLRGRLYHETLSRAVRPEEDPRRASTRLDAAFAEAEKELELDRLPGWEGERLEHLARLRRLAESEVFAEPGAVAHALEHSFETGWWGFRVRGRIDRADRVAEQLVLYDYKAGKSAPKGVQDGEGRLKIDLQLPLYRELAPAVFEGMEVKEAYYLLVGAAKRKPAASPDVSLEDVAEQLRRHLEEGSFPVAPDTRGDACTFCPFDLVCRRGPRLWRKEGQP